MTLRILDPACGSGSFLLGAYQYLLDWYRDRYVEKDPEKLARKKTPLLYQAPGGEWRLTTTERKRILLDHIYGVDIDPQAVEVTKLSLLLKVLEGENQQTIGKHYALFHERVLPDLADNIKCGNSLIGSDFYHNKEMSLFNEDEIARVNAFDWEEEFPEVFEPRRRGDTEKDKGFDVVIGNPPYVRQESLKDQKSYFKDNYNVYHGVADLYTYFIERGFGFLRSNGLFGMIISNKWLRAAYGRPLREFLKNEVGVKQIVDMAGLPVFSGATVRTLILVCSPLKNENITVRYLKPVPLDEFHTIKTGDRLKILFDEQAIELSMNTFSSDGWSLSPDDSHALVQRFQGVSIPLSTYINGKTFFGIKTGLNKAFIIDADTRNFLLRKEPKANEIIKPLVVGKDIRRYAIDFKDRYLIWTYIGVPIEKYPVILDYLKQYQTQLEKRWDKGNYWWELRACDYYEKFEQPKIIYPDISTTCRFALDNGHYYSSNTTYFIPGNDLYLLGILNSRLGQFYFTEVCAGLEGGGTNYLRFFGQYLAGFPVKSINQGDPKDIAKREEIISSVENMLDLNKRLQSVKTDHERKLIERQIASTDKEIDRLVYELYGLTEEEIKIVQDANASA